MVKVTVTLLYVAVSLGGGMCSVIADILVTSYGLNLTVMEPLTQVPGSVDVGIHFLKGTSTITLGWGSSLGVPYRENFTGSSPSAAFGVHEVHYNSSGAHVTIILDSAFSEDDRVNLSIRFIAKVNKDQKGLFMRQFNSVATKWNLLVTSFYPSYARELFPCVDEPAMPTLFYLTLNVPTGYEVATSLQPVGSTSDQGTQTTTRMYESTSSMPTYALALLITNGMRAVSYINTHSTNITFWLPKASRGTSYDNSIKLMYELFCKIGDILNQSRLTPTVNIVLVPELPSQFAGKNVIFIRNTIYYSSKSEGLSIEKVAPVVYQFVRQFTEFRNFLASWNDAWLSHAMTSFLQYAFLYSVGSSLDARKYLEVEVRQEALALDSCFSRPLEASSLIDGTPPSLVEESVLDPLKKVKGVALLSMLDLCFPAGSVFSTIKTLMQKDKGSVSSLDFYKELSNVVNRRSSSYRTEDTQIALANVGYWFNTSGYPLVYLDTSSTTQIAINQVKFRSCPVSSWKVPVTIGSSKDPRLNMPRQNVWVDATGVNSSVAGGEWILSDTLSAGYYRVQYNDDNWKRLAASSLPPPRRSHMLDDAFILSASGLLDYDIPLRLALRDVNNLTYFDWFPVYNGVSRLRDALWATELYPAFQRFYTPLLQHINTLVEGGFSNPYDSDKTLSLFFEDLCKYNIGHTRTLAESGIVTLLHGYPPSTVSSSSYAPMACCGGQFTSIASADTLWDTVKDSSASFDQRYYNSIALGCLPDDSFPLEKLRNVLHKIPELEDSKFYVSITLKYLAKLRPHTILTIIAEDPDYFQTQLGASILSSVISTASRKLQNDHIVEVKRIAAGRVGDGVRGAVAAAIEDISARTSWLASHNSTLMSTLETHTLPSGTQSGCTTAQALLATPCLAALLMFN